MEPWSHGVWLTLRPHNDVVITFTTFTAVQSVALSTVKVEIYMTEQLGTL